MQASQHTRHHKQLEVASPTADFAHRRVLQQQPSHILHTRSEIAYLPTGASPALPSRPLHPHAQHSQPSSAPSSAPEQHAEQPRHSHPSYAPLQTPLARPSGPSDTAGLPLQASSAPEQEPESLQQAAEQPPVQQPPLVVFAHKVARPGRAASISASEAASQGLGNPPGVSHGSWGDLHASLAHLRIPGTAVR